ncbi:MAG: hypothetical protein ACI8UD_003268 [Planctomycetota bacterium]|jgi:hypothetical protein
MAADFSLKLLLITFAGNAYRDHSRLITYLLEENCVFRPSASIDRRLSAIAGHPGPGLHARLHQRQRSPSCRPYVPRKFDIDCVGPASGNRASHCHEYQSKRTDSASLQRIANHGSFWGH